MPAPSFSGYAMNWLKAMACSCVVSLAHAQEFPLMLPGSDRVPNFNQCRSDFDSQYQREMQSALKVISVWEEQIVDLKKRRAELEDNRLFFGLGPKADSEAAFDIALGLQAVSGACDVLTTLHESMNPRAGILGRYTRRKFSALNVFNLLKTGEFINDVMSSDGLGEAFYTIFKEFGPMSPEVQITENFKDAIENHKAWEGYREDLKSGLRQLEQQMQDAQRRIHAEQRRIKDDLRKGFADFCALEKPPRTEPDSLEGVSGQSVALAVAANDVDPDGGALRLVELNTQKNGNRLRGKVYIDHTQSFTGVVRYLAPDEFEGVETFDYAIVDDEGQRAWGSVSVRVTRRRNENEGSAGRVASGSSGLAGPSQADIDAIWARCRDSPNITQCVDAGLAGQLTDIQSGRLHPGCEQTRDLIAADQAEIAKLEKEIARKSGAPGLVSSNMDYERIKILKWRIEQTRRDGNAKWGCN
jgi:hypothetical protein